MRASPRYLTLALVVVATLVLAGTSGATTSARTSAACSIPHGGENLGPTYLTSLTVASTSCTTGLAVVKAYHACQLKHGGVKAKCSATVDGFRCTEKRGPSIPTEFYSSVSCSDRSEHVSYKYSQFS